MYIIISDEYEVNISAGHPSLVITWHEVMVWKEPVWLQVRLLSKVTRIAWIRCSREDEWSQWTGLQQM